VTQKPEIDDDRVCSTLTWKDVVLPLSVGEADLDALIFAETDKCWLKVAGIVGNVFRTLETRCIRLPMEIIAAHIAKLVEVRRLESQGNLTMWRHSEVRLPRN
jgi:Protein of unknown function